MNALAFIYSAHFTFTTCLVIAKISKSKVINPREYSSGRKPFIHLFFFFQILSRISLELTLGLLSALRSDLYGTCQYWLQSLSHCNKHCLFVLQRELCCILLPQGTQSLENLLGLSHELRGVNDYDVSNEEESIAQLFLHFHAFYCEALMIEIWYRCPNILASFQHHQDVSAEVKEAREASDSNYDSSANLVDAVALKTGPIKSENASAISDNCRISGAEKVEEQIAEVRVGMLAVDEDSRSKVDTKEPFSSAKRNLVAKQDLKSTLQKAKEVLLSDHHAKISNLRDLLTEIRKAMLLKRSKQFLQMNSASSKLNQKKKKAKAQTAFSSQPLGFSPSSHEGHARSKTASRSGVSDSVESTQSESRDDNGTVLTGHSGTQMEVAGMDVKYTILGNEGDKQDESSNEQANRGGLSDELKTVLATETGTKDWTTLDGNLPIDLRYMTSDISLESMAEEEEQVLRQLEQLEFKVCSFISPRDLSSCAK